MCSAGHRAEAAGELSEYIKFIATEVHVSARLSQTLYRMNLRQNF